MNTNRRAIDLAMDVSRSVLPPGLFCKLSQRLIEWEAGRSLDRLAGLSDRRHETVAELSSAEKQACIDRFTLTTSRIRTYRTRLEVREACDSDGDRPAAEVTLDATVVRPDRLHVRQIAGDDYDEWITIGDATWETMSLELGLSDQRGTSSVRSPVNRRFHIARYIQLLAASSPTRGWTVRSRGHPMTCLTWDTLSPEAFECLAVLDRELIDDGRVRHASMAAWLWQDGRLARFDLVLTDDYDDAMELSQAFAMYDYPFQIADPSEESPS